MKLKKITLIMMSVALLLVGCGNNSNNMLDETANSQMQVTEDVTPTVDITEVQQITADEQISPTDTVTPIITIEQVEEPTQLVTPTPAEEIIRTSELPSIEEDMRGVWVATLRNIDYPKIATVDSNSLKAEADSVIANCAAIGINNIFLQVRPTCDAFYKSSIYPWSKYCTGVQGVAPADGFDPLEYWISQCHANGIKLHAWVNPYRVTRDNDGADSEYISLPETNPAKQHPEWLVRHKNNYYFDPAIPEVRQLVLDGVMEIVNNYDVDGIHFDDYFYPNEGDEVFNDAVSFAVYNNGYTDKAQWRRNNVNMLVQSINPAIKSVKSHVAFGISPSGIWANSKSNPEGSNTSGMEAYNQLFADTRMWAQSEWVDYIAPQLYWTIGYDKADFATLANWWSKQVAGHSTRLYMGLAAYKTLETKTNSDWYGEKGINMIAREMDIIDTSSEIDGEIFYNYSSLSGNQSLRNYVTVMYGN